jgi:hypothetical protein
MQPMVVLGGISVIAILRQVATQETEAAVEEKKVVALKTAPAVVKKLAAKKARSGCRGRISPLRERV